MFKIKSYQGNMMTYLGPLHLEIFFITPLLDTDSLCFLAMDSSEIRPSPVPHGRTLRLPPTVNYKPSPKCNCNCCTNTKNKLRLSWPKLQLALAGVVRCARTRREHANLWCLTKIKKIRFSTIFLYTSKKLFYSLLSTRLKIYESSKRNIQIPPALSTDWHP